MILLYKRDSSPTVHSHHYPIYIISLERSKIRRKHVLEQAEQNDFIIFNAIEGNNLTFEQQYFVNNYVDKSNLTSGELGCMLSHFYLWEEIISKQIDYALILEDDFKLSKDTYDLVTTLATETNLDFIFLGHCCEKVKGRLLYQFEHYHVREAKEALCTWGYLITFHGCQVLVDYIRAHNCTMSIDNQIHVIYTSNLLKAATVIPRPITHINFKSTIR